MKHIKLSTSYKISNDESMAGGIGRIYNTDGKHEESHNMIVKSGRQMIIENMFNVIKSAITNKTLKLFFSTDNTVTTPEMETEKVSQDIVVALNECYDEPTDKDDGNYIFINRNNCLLHIHAWVHTKNPNDETHQLSDSFIKVGSAGLLVDGELFSRMTFRPYNINYGDDTCFDYDIYF